MKTRDHSDRGGEADLSEMRKRPDPKSYTPPAAPQPDLKQISHPITSKRLDIRPRCDSLEN